MYETSPLIGVTFELIDIDGVAFRKVESEDYRLKALELIEGNKNSLKRW